MNQDLWSHLFEKLSFSEFSRLKQTCHHVESLCIDYESKLINSIYRNLTQNQYLKGEQHLWNRLVKEMDQLIYNETSIIEKWNNLTRIIHLYQKYSIIDRLFCSQSKTIDDILLNEKSLIHLLEYYFCLDRKQLIPRLLDPLMREQIIVESIDDRLYHKFLQIPQTRIETPDNYQLSLIFESEIRSIIESSNYVKFLCNDDQYCIHPQLFHERFINIRRCGPNVGDWCNLLYLPTGTLTFLYQHSAYFSFYFNYDSHCYDVFGHRFFQCEPILCFIDEPKLKVLIKYRQTFEKIPFHHRIFYYKTIREIDDLDELDQRMQILVGFGKKFLSRNIDFVAYRIFCEPSSIIVERKKHLSSIKFIDGYTKRIVHDLLLLPTEGLKQAASVINKHRKIIGSELNCTICVQWRFLLVAILSMADDCESLNAINVKDLCTFAKRCTDLSVYQDLIKNQPINVKKLLETWFYLRDLLLPEMTHQSFCMIIHHHKNLDELKQKIHYLGRFLVGSYGYIFNVRFDRLSMMHLEILAKFANNHSIDPTLLNCVSFFKTNDNSIEQFLTQYFATLIK